MTWVWWGAAGCATLIVLASFAVVRAGAVLAKTPRRRQPDDDDPSGGWCWCDQPDRPGPHGPYWCPGVAGEVAAWLQRK